MLDLVEIRDALRDRRLDVVSAATGLPRNTIAAVRDGTTKNPTYRVLKALSDYFLNGVAGGARGQSDDE